MRQSGRRDPLTPVLAVYFILWIIGAILALTGVIH